MGCSTPAQIATTAGSVVAVGLSSSGDLLLANATSGHWSVVDLSKSVRISQVAAVSAPIFDGAGSIHLVETLEFLYTVKKIGWESALKLDLFPYRESPVLAVKESVTTLRKLEACVDRLDFAALNAAQSKHDAMAVQGIIRDALIK